MCDCMCECVRYCVCVSRCMCECVCDYTCVNVCDTVCVYVCCSPEGASSLLYGPCSSASQSYPNQLEWLYGDSLVPLCLVSPPGHLAQQPSSPGSHKIGARGISYMCLLTGVKDGGSKLRRKISLPTVNVFKTRTENEGHLHDI